MVGREITNFYPKETVPIGDAILEVKDFTVRHPSIPDRTIVDHASFVLHKGEILGLAGLVGAGRSELVNAIFGKDRKISGSVELDGKELEIRSPKDAIDNGIALVTEDRKADGIVAGMTIAENITLPNLQAISNHQIMKLKEKMHFQRNILTI